MTWTIYSSQLPNIRDGSDESDLHAGWREPSRQTATAAEDRHA